MNLISCDECGVVLNKDKLCFPRDIYNEKENNCEVDGRYGDFNPNTGTWCAYVPCPVCKTHIFKD